MAIKVGDLNIASVLVGQTEASAVYVGDTRVWQRELPPAVVLFAGGAETVSGTVATGTQPPLSVGVAFAGWDETVIGDVLTSAPIPLAAVAALVGGTESAEGVVQDESPTNLSPVVSLGGGSEAVTGNIALSMVETLDLYGGVETGGGQLQMNMLQTAPLAGGTEVGAGDLTVEDKALPTTLALVDTGVGESGLASLTIHLQMQASYSGGKEVGGGDLTAAYDLTDLSASFAGGTELGVADLTIVDALTASVSNDAPTTVYYKAGTVTAAAAQVHWTLTGSGGTGPYSVQWQYSGDGASWINWGEPVTKLKTISATASHTPSAPATRYGRAVVTDSESRTTTSGASGPVTWTLLVDNEFTAPYSGGTEVGGGNATMNTAMTLAAKGGKETGAGALDVAYKLTPITLSLSGGTEAGGGDLQQEIPVTAALAGGTEAGGADLTAAFDLTAITLPLASGTETGGGDLALPVPTTLALSGGTETGTAEVDIPVAVTLALSGGTEVGGGDLTYYTFSAGSGTYADPYILDATSLPNGIDISEFLAGVGFGDSDAASTHFQITVPAQQSGRTLKITVGEGT